MSIHIRGFRESPILCMEEQQTATPHVDKDSNVSTTPMTELEVEVPEIRQKPNLLKNVLIAPSHPLRRVSTADGLPAEDLTTKQADIWIHSVFTGRGATSLRRFFN